MKTDLDVFCSRFMARNTYNVIDLVVRGVVPYEFKLRSSFSVL